MSRARRYRQLLALLPPHHAHPRAAQRALALLADVEAFRLTVDQLADGEMQVADAAAGVAPLARDRAILHEERVQIVYQAAHSAPHILAWTIGRQCRLIVVVLGRRLRLWRERSGNMPHDLARRRGMGSGM